MKSTDDNFWRTWHPATNGAVRGWWITKGDGGTGLAQMHLARNGRLITFKKLASAKRRCAELNQTSLDSKPNP